MSSRRTRLQWVWWGFFRPWDWSFGMARAPRSLRRIGFVRWVWLGPLEVRVWAEKPVRTGTTTSNL